MGDQQDNTKPFIGGVVVGAGVAGLLYLMFGPQKCPEPTLLEKPQYDPCRDTYSKPQQKPQSDPSKADPPKADPSNDTSSKKQKTTKYDPCNDRPNKQVAAESPPLQLPPSQMPPTLRRPCDCDEKRAKADKKKDNQFEPKGQTEFDKCRVRC